MHVLSVHYITIFFFFTLFDPTLLFVMFFRVTLTTDIPELIDFLKKKKKKKFFFFFFFLEIHKINLGRTCFDRVGRKSETNNIFF